MHKALHPRDDVDRLLASRKKKGGRELASIEDSVNASIQPLEDYVKKQRKTNYRDQKQRKQHKNQQKNYK